MIPSKEDRAARALDYFHQGYNCSQSLVQSLAASFKQEFGTLYCRELLGLSPESLAAETARPGERTAAYYASRPCERCIAFCARCAAELEAKARHHENTRPPLQGNRAL